MSSSFKGDEEYKKVWYLFHSQLVPISFISCSQMTYAHIKKLWKLVDETTGCQNDSQALCYPLLGCSVNLSFSQPTKIPFQGV